MNGKDLLLKSGIFVDVAEEEIKSGDGIVLPVFVSGKKVFFKFLTKEFKDQLLREVHVVNILRENNCKVPLYFELGGQVIFEADSHIYYGTYEALGKPSHQVMNLALLKEIMVELAKMHKVLRTIPIKEKKESDLDRFRMFYEKNKDFFQHQNFDQYIEKVLSDKYEEEQVSYIHADLNFNNIFAVNNHVTTFIDFTDLRIGYVEDDIGKLFQNVVYFGVTEEELRDLIFIYEQELGDKINRKNLLVSLVFRMMYRYVCFVNNKEGNVRDYKEKTEKLLQEIIREQI